MTINDIVTKLTARTPSGRPRQMLDKIYLAEEYSIADLIKDLEKINENTNTTRL